MATEPDCPKCGKAMERGHMPDVSYGVILQSSWAAGDPVHRKYVGGIKWKADQVIPIVACRCTRCGFVELYAPVE